MKKNSIRQVNRKVWEMKSVVERVCVAIYLPGFLVAAGNGLTCADTSFLWQEISGTVTLRDQAILPPHHPALGVGWLLIILQLLLGEYT